MRIVEHCSMHALAIGALTLAGATAIGIGHGALPAGDGAFLSDRPPVVPAAPAMRRDFRTDVKTAICLFSAAGGRTGSLRNVEMAGDQSWMHMTGAWRTGGAVDFTARFFTWRTDVKGSVEIMQVVLRDGATIRFGFHDRFLTIEKDSTGSRPPDLRDLDLTADDPAKEVRTTDAAMRPDEADIGGLARRALICIRPI